MFNSLFLLITCKKGVQKYNFNRVIPIFFKCVRALSIFLEMPSFIIVNTKDKYQSALDLGKQLGVRDGKVSEENGILKIKGGQNPV